MTCCVVCRYDLVILFCAICSLLSLAEFAKEYSLVRPEFVDDNVILVQGGRYGSDCGFSA